MHSMDIVKPALNEAEVFWGEISPCEHLVQIYQNDGVFLDSPRGICSGWDSGRRWRGSHCDPAVSGVLSERLSARGIDVGAASRQDQYLTLDAVEALSKFIVMGWPDENLFNAFVTGTLQRVKGESRRVRAFGEMVALLWARGNTGATAQLWPVNTNRQTVWFDAKSYAWKSLSPNSIKLPTACLCSGAMSA